MDTDGSGFITIAELGQALEICGIRLPGYQIRDIITQYDSKIQDNKLDLEEFKAVSFVFIFVIPSSHLPLCYINFICDLNNSAVYG